MDIDPIVYVLKRYRENRSMSQAKLSEATGISLRTIQRIESGETDLKMSQYRRYLEALSLSDMDISISLMSHHFVTEREVAAVTRRFPFRIKQVLVRFLNELAEALKE
ncbi:helix-turn-helix domain-containing protein [Vibrio owensii]|uniref:helix-turn-helix domain-containing protein n=1 Tax=Vibrio owensii TaxID=696485 RepID=UPI001F10F9A0|nr:helix-turn-helix transcriptional regulator [Vibrio owensii]